MIFKNFFTKEEKPKEIINKPDKKDRDDKSAEELVDSEFAVMEKKENVALNLLNDVGGLDGVEDALKKMSDDKINKLDEKIRIIAKRVDRLKIESAESFALLEIPAMVSAFLLYLSNENDGISFDNEGGRVRFVFAIMSSISAMIPVLSTIHSLKNHKEFISGIVSFVKSIKENKEWKKIVKEKESFLSSN